MIVFSLQTMAQKEAFFAPQHINQQLHLVRERERTLLFRFVLSFCLASDGLPRQARDRKQKMEVCGEWGGRRLTGRSDPPAPAPGSGVLKVAGRQRCASCEAITPAPAEENGGVF